MQKQCFKCGRTLDLSEFYKHPNMADGHLNKCKECARKYSIKNRNDKIDYYREYDKKRMYAPQRIKAREEYAKSEAGKKVRYKTTKKYRTKHPERAKIYRDCEKTLNNPHICSQCGGDIMVEAHHDNYNEPFKVRWLCRLCHRQWHKTHKPKENNNE